MEKLVEEPLMLRQPLVRFGQRLTIGYEPKTWEAWAREQR